MADIILRMYETTIEDAIILRVAAGTTGLMGGDAGHGGETIIEIENEQNAGAIFFGRPRNNLLRISLGGDAELRVMIKAMEHITKTLRREMGE